MTVWLTIFIISGSAIILFLAFKLIQQKFNILLFWPGARESVEKRLKSHQQKILNVFDTSEGKEGIYILWAITYVPRMVGWKIKQWLMRKSHGVVKVVQGKQGIENRGEALRRLSSVGRATVL
jgi:hypothetical protein